MTLSISQIIGIFIWSSVVGMGSVLDEFQTNRFLVSCSMTGLILGDLKAGVILGGTLELIALGWMNIGAAQSPDSALASVIATILVIVGHQAIQKGIVIALPVAMVGQALTVLVRKNTIRIQRLVDREAEKANFSRIIFLHFSALFLQAMRVAIPATLVAAFVNADTVTHLLNAIPKVVTDGLAVAGGMIVVVGYALLLMMMYTRYLLPFFFLGFIVAGYLNFSLIAFVVLGVIIAIIYVQLNPIFVKSIGTVVVNTATLADDELED